MVEFHTDANGVHKHVVTPIGELHDISPTVLAGLPIGAVDVLLCADDIVHDDDTHVKAKIVRNAFCGNEFCTHSSCQPANFCWPMCSVTMITRQESGSAFVPRWTTW